MAQDDRIYGEVNSISGLKKIFMAIRRDVATANSRTRLTELHKRAGYLITLTYSPAWEEKFGKVAATLRKVAVGEFGTTARKINRRAKRSAAKRITTRHGVTNNPVNCFGGTNGASERTCCNGSDAHPKTGFRGICGLCGSRYYH